MADWVVDKKRKTATAPIFGGELVVSLGAQGQPIAKWSGNVPAEEGEWRAQRARDGLQALVDARASDEDLERAKAAVDAASALPAVIREEGDVHVTAFIHVHGGTRNGMKFAPAIIFNSLRKSHPQFASGLTAEQPSSLPDSDPF